MDFNTTVISKKLKNVDHASLLSLYIDAPQEEISLDEFELFALDRLSLLRSIETLKARGGDGRDMVLKMQQLENKYMPLKSSDRVVDAHGRNAGQRKDLISHFILRLAYCRTEDLRRWFLAQEQALFKYRIECLNNDEYGAFMRANGMDYEALTTEQKYEVKEQLLATGLLMPDIEKAVYRVPFQEALPLIAGRQVYLVGGYAFIPMRKLMNVIISRFRMNLSKSLAVATQFFDYASADSRIGSLLKNMNKQYTGKDFTKSQSIEKLTPENVEDAAMNNMPLCMKNLHTHLKVDHKLKHWGRLQYGLFLKAAGMELDDAVRFWESMFTKIMSHDDFNKKYAYNVRHMYGKEGARKNYTPYSCMKIIMGAAPEVGAFHGCPYKHMPENQLTNLLNSMKISKSPSDISDIVALAKGSTSGGGNHFGLACQKHFDLTHPDHAKMSIPNSENVAVHPNQWYQASVTYHMMKTNTASGKKAVNANEPSSNSTSTSNTLDVADQSKTMNLEMEEDF